MQESLDEPTFEDIGGVFEQMDEHHPTDEHWYPPLIGVDPLAQGHGLGAALLRHALKTCDSDGLPGLPRSDQPAQPQPRSAPRLRRHADHPGGNLTTALGDAPTPVLRPNERALQRRRSACWGMTEIERVGSGLLGSRWRGTAGSCGLATGFWSLGRRRRWRMARSRGSAMRGLRRGRRSRTSWRRLRVSGRPRRTSCGRGCS